jgi:hypothetical protein
LRSPLNGINVATTEEHEQMRESRRWIATFLLVSGLLSLATGRALACMTMPRNLARPHPAVIAEAKQIFWAEVLGTQPAKHVEKARKPVRYKLRVVRALKGQVGSGIELDGEGDLSGIWDTTFSNHIEHEFWKHSAGRMGVEGNCSMVPPHFIVGKRYLVLLSASEDTKQFERVDVESDRWLKYVESKTAGSH